MDEDPPDSEGPGAKECSGGGALDVEPNGIALVSVVDNASDVDIAGTDPPPYVLKMTSTTIDGDNSWQINGNMPQHVENTTVCSRTYQRFGADLPPIFGELRAKLSEMILDVQLIQHQIEISGLGLLDTFPGDCIGTADMQTAGQWSWLRHEVCLDIGVNSVSSRTRMVVIETGETDTVACGPYPITTPADFSTYLIGNLYLQTNGMPEAVGSRYVTHAIQALVPLNTAFWIGAASELEDDTDADGVVQITDNCSAVKNTLQVDSDSDGCGNACDFDFNQNGAVDSGDFIAFTTTFLKGLGDPSYNANADVDGNNAINAIDFFAFSARYQGAPGPSGLPSDQRDTGACP